MERYMPSLLNVARGLTKSLGEMHAGMDTLPSVILDFTHFSVDTCYNEVDTCYYGISDFEANGFVGRCGHPADRLQGLRQAEAQLVRAELSCGIVAPRL